MSKYEEKPEAPMLPTEDGFLDYVAMDNEMTGAFPAVTEGFKGAQREAYGRAFDELYGLPLGFGEEKPR